MQNIKSLSARRAWIEMSPGRIWSTALGWSLSARRAWIVIGIVNTVLSCIMGSLSARRAWIEILNAGILRPWACCRSPQGERG